jgi:ribosomal-protein-alanine N-acetyltransferase
MPSVTLHHVTASNGPELIAANLASRALHAPWVSPCTDEAGFAAWLEALERPANASFLIRDAAGALAGVINLSQIVLGNFCSAYTGFYAVHTHAGNGFMSAGLRLAITHAFETLGLHRLEANIQPENVRSKTLVQRLGFRQEGCSPAYLRIAGAWRDHERWALLAPERNVTP